MQRINVDIESLQSAVSYFLMAAREFDELDYRLKLLGNEFADDAGLLLTPEYELIMTHYAELSKHIAKVRNMFETLTSPVSKIPEIYSEAERRSIERTNNLFLRTDRYQKSFVDETMLVKISPKNTDELQEEELIDIIQKNFVDSQSFGITT